MKDAKVFTGHEIVYAFSVCVSHKYKQAHAHIDEVESTLLYSNALHTFGAST